MSTRSDRGARSRAPLLLTALLVLGGCAAPEEPYHPDVLLIVIDALRADHVGVNGYPLPTTPTIDALAADGVTFRRASAHSTWTKPSMASLFTSIFPVQHGMNRVAFVAEGGLSTDVLAEELTTLAERFRDAGYATGGAVNQPHLLRRFGFAQGFDFYRDVRGAGAYKLNWAIQSWLEKLEPERPFFAYLHYLDAHWPYTKRIDDAEAFGPIAMERQPPRSGHEVPEWLAAGLGEKDRRALVARYDQEIAWADRALGSLWEWLQESGRADDLVVVVTSDHGEGFLEHGELLHGYAPYEEVIQVPLVVRLPPRLRAAKPVVEEPVGLVDLLPSLLELSDLPPEPQAFGRSWVPLLSGGRWEPRTLFAESEEAVAAFTAEKKLLRFSDGRLEFYDLGSDPQERRPAEDCPGPCRELARAIRTYLDLPSYAATDAELGAEEIEDLRSLGYLD